MDVSTRLVTGATPHLPAMREILSGQVRDTTTQIDSLTKGLDSLRCHVDRMEHQRSSVEAEYQKQVATFRRSEKQLRFSLPAIVSGGALSLLGGLAQAFMPSVAGIVAVCVGSAALMTGGILASTGRMNQTESSIMGNGARDQLQIIDDARTRAQADMASKQQQLEALRQQEAELLHRAHAEMARPAAPGAIQMEPESVRIGNLTVPRRLDG